MSRDRTKMDGGGARGAILVVLSVVIKLISVFFSYLFSIFHTHAQMEYLSFLSRLIKRFVLLCCLLQMCLYFAVIIFRESTVSRYCPPVFPVSSYHGIQICSSSLQCLSAWGICVTPNEHTHKQIHLQVKLKQCSQPI